MGRLVIVVVVGVFGTLLLGVGVNAERGGPVFFVATMAVALLWILGGLAAAPSHMFERLAPSDGWRDTAWGLGVGGGLLVVFLLGAAVVAQIPFLAGPAEELLAHAQWGSLRAVAVVTAISAVTEEVYFRGALFDVIRLDSAVGDGRLDTPPDGGYSASGEGDGGSASGEPNGGYSANGEGDGGYSANGERDGGSANGEGDGGYSANGEGDGGSAGGADDGWRRIAITTGIYALVTVSTGVVLLVFAATVLGAAVGWLRERTASLVAPIVAHVIWSLGMLYFLPSALDFWR